MQLFCLNIETEHRNNTKFAPIEQYVYPIMWEYLFSARSYCRMCIMCLLIRWKCMHGWNMCIHANCARYSLEQLITKIYYNHMWRLELAHFGVNWIRLYCRNLLWHRTYRRASVVSMFIYRPTGKSWQNSSDGANCLHIGWHVTCGAVRVWKSSRANKRHAKQPIIMSTIWLLI